jgi:hypothetical protein
MHKVGLKPYKKIKAISHVFLVLGHMQKCAKWFLGPQFPRRGNYAGSFPSPLLVLPTKGKDIVFRFIIEYSSLRNLVPR